MVWFGKFDFARFAHSPWGSALTITVVMQFPFALDAACVWDLRTSHLAGGGGYAIMMAALKNSCCVAGAYLLLGRAVKYLCIPLLWLVAVVAGLEIFTRTCFGFNFEGDWILTIRESSPSETAVFVREYMVPLAVVLFCVLLGCAAGTRALCWLKTGKRRWPCYVVGVLLLVPACLRELNADSWGRHLGSVQTKRVVADTFVQMKVYNDLFAVSQFPDIVESPFVATNAADVVGLIVVGESATRNEMSLYGCDRPTTPVLDRMADELYVFQDVVTTVGSTPRSCRFIFTESTLRNQDAAYCTLPQVLKRAGVQSCLVSSQGRWGGYEHVGGYLFHDCRRKLYLSEMCKTKFYDSAVLPHLADELAVGSNRVVFVHLAGSHFPPGLTYPSESAVFPGNDKVAHYDNSIHFTDKVLGEMIKQLRTIGKPSFMLYVSDHGETPHSETWRDPADDDLWEVPLIVWLSPEYKERFPEVAARLKRVLDKPIQTDRIFKLFLSLARVEGFVGHVRDDDVLSDSFDGHKVRPCGGRVR